MFRSFRLQVAILMVGLVGQVGFSSIAKAAEHPLDPEIRIANKRIETIEKEIKDYEAVLVKQERVGDTLRDHEFMLIRVRHDPFSVYLKFKGPKDIKGQQVVYIEGKNDNKMIAQPIGLKGLGGPYELDPKGILAMHNQRYPITEIGFLKLTKKLVKVAEKDRKFGECKVLHYKDVKLEDRVCSVTEVIHPVKRKEFSFHKARIYIDKELDIPIRFESYTWPEKKDGKPVLEEEYHYRKLKVNNGFTDADFEIKKLEKKKK